MTKLLPKVGMLLSKIGILQGASPPWESRVPVGSTRITRTVPSGRIIIPRVGRAHRAVEVPNRTRTDFAAIRFVVVLVIITAQPETIDIHCQSIQPMVTQPRKIIDILREVLSRCWIGPAPIIERGIEFIKVTSQPTRLCGNDIFLLGVNPTESPHRIHRESAVARIKSVLLPQVSARDTRLRDITRADLFDIHPVTVPLDFFH